MGASCIGERHDADAGLQCLNARYYDLELGLFLRPDWLPVTKAGVGTNRYAYAANDPINKFDPNGNVFCDPIKIKGPCRLRSRSRRCWAMDLF